MDAQTQAALAQMLRARRVAALGTLHAEGPRVSLVPYAVAPDFSAFYIQISRLAQHTQDILRDPRVGLLIAEEDSGSDNPQALARLSLGGEAGEILSTASGYETARQTYLARFPAAAFNFSLGDFSLYQIQPLTARYVHGFGKIFDLTATDLRSAATRNPA